MKYQTMWLAVVAAFLLVPLTVSAAVFRSADETITINRGEVVNDDMYVAAGDVRIDGTVNGDLFVAGGQVRVNGTITGDLFMAGGQVMMRGTVEDDVRLVGGNILIEGTTGDDLLVAGGNVEISEFGVVKGDVMAGAGQLTLSGTMRDVDAAVGQLSVSSTAKIAGDLNYRADKDATIAEGAAISGAVNRLMIEPPVAKKGIGAFVAAGSILSLVTTILLALLLTYIIPVKSRALTVDWRDRFGTNLLWGFLGVIITPILIIILLTSIIGVPVAVGLLFLYVALLYLAKLVGAIALGSWIHGMWQKEKTRPMWLSIIIGAVLLTILSFIPLLGWLAKLLIILAALGALMRFDWQLVQDLRAKKTI